ncbi:MAG: hypothetical protein E7317_00270 [Clostridiales bacterium]|nr:hypothetical protein [Clostridiales bacterium]
MKRALCILVLIVMALGLAGAQAEEDYYSFTPIMLNAIDKTSSSWFSTSYNRALFACLALGDLLLDGYYPEIDTGYMMNASYVGQDRETGQILTLVAYNDTGTLFIYYAPVLGKAYVNEEAFPSDVKEIWGDSLMGALIESMDSAEFIKNDKSEVLEASQDIVEILKQAIE